MQKGNAENDFVEATKLGNEVLHHLTKGGHPPPDFLPQARGLIFYETKRVGGLGIGFEHGRGFVISRLPYSAASQYHENWSPPWFIKISGLEWGAIFGVEKISVLVGVMSERALKELTTGSKIALGSDYSICMAYAGLKSSRAQKHPEVMFDSDLCCAAVSTAGFMVDIGFSGTVFHRDKERTERCYGPEITSAQVLGGAVPPVPEMEELALAIQNASRAALVAAFEPSNEVSESE